MEQLIINIPESKSVKIKSFLRSMGVDVSGTKTFDIDAYRKKVKNIGAWTDGDVKIIEDNRNAFGSFKPQN